jgi:hypothetical protein
MGVSDDIMLGAEKDAAAHSSGSAQESKPDSPSHGTSLQQEQEHEPQQNEGDASPRTVHGWKWGAAAVSLYVGALIYGLDGTIAADIHSAIIEQFGNVEQLTWIGTAFPLGSVCAILPG